MTAWTLVQPVCRFARRVLILLLAGLAAATTFLVMTLAGGFWGLLIGASAFPIWVAGTFIVGGPTWALLQACGPPDLRVTIATATIASAVAPFLIVWSVAGLPISMPSYGAAEAMIAVLFGVPGAIAGLVLWKLAYGSQGPIRTCRRSPQA